MYSTNIKGLREDRLTSVSCIRWYKRNKVHH